MITIQSAMLVVLGFLCASLIVLLIAPAFWRRAVRLTSKRVKEKLPFTEEEIRADKDRIRAEYAIRVHRLESKAKTSKIASSRRLIEINRRDASIVKLEADLDKVKGSLEENRNARRVLEQTVADRLPKVEQRLADAKRQLFNRDRELSELAKGTKRQDQALAEAVQINEQQASQIDRLNSNLAARNTSAKRSTGTRDSGFEVELALRSELESMRARAREQAGMIGRLQEQIGSGSGRGRDGMDRSYGSAGAMAASAAGSAEAELVRLREDLSQAEAALRMSTGNQGDNDAVLNEAKKENSRLQVIIQDHVGEISTLKAALEVFEKSDPKATGKTIRDTKIALKSRLNSVQTQAGQQSQLIQKLRADLAATHERMARQAQLHAIEMRRLGTGTLPAAGVARLPSAAKRSTSLADRIAPPLSQISRGEEVPNGYVAQNGQATQGSQAAEGSRPAPSLAPSAATVDPADASKSAKITAGTQAPKAVASGSAKQSPPAAESKRNTQAEQVTAEQVMAPAPAKRIMSAEKAKDRLGLAERLTQERSLVEPVANGPATNGPVTNGNDRPESMAQASPASDGETVPAATARKLVKPQLSSNGAAAKSNAVNAARGQPAKGRSGDAEPGATQGSGRRRSRLLDRITGSAKN